jgi:hypothetical protein
MLHRRVQLKEVAMLKWTMEFYRVTVNGDIPKIEQLNQWYQWEKIEFDQATWFDNKNQIGKEVTPEKTYEYWVGEPDPIIGEEEAKLFEETRKKEPNMNKHIDPTRRMR